MTILSRYILREVLRIFGMCFAGLMTVYLVIDFFEKLRKFLKPDVELADILLYFLFMTPHISFQIAPVAVLMATLLSIGLLSRSNEITAMRSCGISLFRIMLPFLGFAAAVSWMLFIMSAVIVPISTLRAEYIKALRIEHKDPKTIFRSDRTWIQSGNQTLVNIEAVESLGTTLKGVSVYRLGQDFQLKEFTEAETARYSQRGWVLHDGIERRLSPEGKTETSTFATKPIHLDQIPEDFNTWLGFESQEMTLVDLKAYAERLRRDGYNFSRYLTDYYGRVAFPFVSLVMAVVGIALSLRLTGVRGGGMAIGIGQALVIAFLYWTAHSVAITLGRSGALIPILAGWFANLVFFSFGCYLILRVRY